MSEEAYLNARGKALQLQGFGLVVSQPFHADEWVLASTGVKEWVEELAT